MDDCLIHALTGCPHATDCIAYGVCLDGAKHLGEWFKMTATCEEQGHLWGPLGKCVMCGHPAPPPGVSLVSGIVRDPDDERTLLICCSRRPTDDEMRAIHESARAVASN